MKAIRTGRIAATVVAATLVVAVTAPAAGAVVGAELDFRVFPNRLPRRPANGFGTPIRLTTNQKLTHPEDSSLRLTRVAVLLPGGVAVPNGRLFPSCTAAALNRARGRLRVCPEGSLVGRGIATGTAVDIGVTSSGRLTFFNGPGGRSLTLNVSIINPALINATFTAPIKKISGRYGYSVTFNIPAQLQTILDGPIVVRRVDATIGATRRVRGVTRGYIEAIRCPASRRVPAEASWTFDDGSVSRDVTEISCR
ncbi:MAG TPA: hypothetical protein VK506_00820 [Conexibacter sp.]|nr:hypothetical protein [Conexibacter sp.]